MSQNLLINLTDNNDDDETKRYKPDIEDQRPDRIHETCILPPSLAVGRCLVTADRHLNK